MRKYQPLWIQLKQHKHVAIAAHPSLHARIIKAVTCEKYRDDGYRIRLSEEDKKTILAHEVTGARIRFFLRTYSLDGSILLENL